MANVRIQSQGTLVTTAVELDGHQINPADLMGLQVYLEPDIEQVGCEINFSRDGKLERWVGANTDDDFCFQLDVVADDIRYRVEATARGLETKISMPDRPEAVGAVIFPKAALLLQLVAEGWNISINKFFRMTDPAQYQALLERKGGESR